MSLRNRSSAALFWINAVLSVAALFVDASIKCRPSSSLGCPMSHRNILVAVSEHPPATRRRVSTSQACHATKSCRRPRSAHCPHCVRHRSRRCPCSVCLGSPRRPCRRHSATRPRLRSRLPLCHQAIAPPFIGCQVSWLGLHSSSVMTPSAGNSLLNWNSLSKL